MKSILCGAISVGAMVAFAGAATAQSTYTQPNFNYPNAYANAAPAQGAAAYGGAYTMPGAAYSGGQTIQATSGYEYAGMAGAAGQPAPLSGHNTFATAQNVYATPQGGFGAAQGTYTGAFDQASAYQQGYTQPGTQPGTQQGAVYSQAQQQQGTGFAPSATFYPPMGGYQQQAATGYNGTAFNGAGFPANAASTYSAQSGAVYQQAMQQFPAIEQANFGTFPQPQPYFPQGLPAAPGQQPQAHLVSATPGTPAAPARPTIEDTDAWTFSFARYFPAIRACLRKSGTENPVIANIHERPDATIMLIGQGGTADYQVCETGLQGTSIRDSQETRPLPPAFYAPMGTSFTIAPERPFQPVTDISNRLVGWIVRTTPVRLDMTGGRGFDGQFIRPITVNTSAG